MEKRRKRRLVLVKFLLGCSDLWIEWSWGALSQVNVGIRSSGKTRTFFFFTKPVPLSWHYLHLKCNHTRVWTRMHYAKKKRHVCSNCNQLSRKVSTNIPRQLMRYKYSMTLSVEINVFKKIIIITEIVYRKHVCLYHPVEWWLSMALKRGQVW